MRRIFGAAILGLLLMLAGTDRTLAARPEWCQPGYVCLETKVAEQRERKIIDLTKAVAEAKAKRLRRFGWTLGLGVVVQPDGEASGGAAVTFGFRF